MYDAETAPGIKACLQGYRVLFRNAPTLSTELTEAETGASWASLLLKAVVCRIERSKTIVTTKLPFSEWTELLENTTMVSALADRPAYHFYVPDLCIVHQQMEQG